MDTLGKSQTLYSLSSSFLVFSFMFSERKKKQQQQQLLRLHDSGLALKEML